MKKILIAIDYALSSQKVAEQGYEIAKAMHAEIVLMHVIEDITYYSSSVYTPIMGFGGFASTNFLSKDVLESIEKEAMVFLEKVKTHLKDKKIKTIVKHGKTAAIILETAKKMKCQLIVAGTHSKSGIEEIILGSTANKLMNHTVIPILIIPTKSRTDEK